MLLWFLESVMASTIGWSLHGFLENKKNIFFRLYITKFLIASDLMRLLKIIYFIKFLEFFENDIFKINMKRVVHVVVKLLIIF